MPHTTENPVTRSSMHVKLKVGTKEADYFGLGVDPTPLLARHGTARFGHDQCRPPLHTLVCTLARNFRTPIIRNYELCMGRSLLAVFVH